MPNVSDPASVPFDNPNAEPRTGQKEQHQERTADLKRRNKRKRCAPIQPFFASMASLSNRADVPALLTDRLPAV